MTEQEKPHVDMKLEAFLLGVTDVDRAKAFYEKLGLRLRDQCTRVPCDSQGESVVVEFESSFTNLTTGREAVTMVQEEGQWRIVGYGIH